MQVHLGELRFKAHLAEGNGSLVEDLEERLIWCRDSVHHFIAFRQQILIFPYRIKVGFTERVTFNCLWYSIGVLTTVLRLLDLGSIPIFGFGVVETLTIKE